MKVIIPNYPAPDSFADNVAHTLRELGHEVMTLPVRGNRWMSSRLNLLKREVHQRFYPSKRTPQETWLVEEARNWKPNILLAVTQVISEDVLTEVRSLGVKYCIAWWGDTVGNMQGTGLLNREWDHIFIKDPHGVEKLNRLGLNVSLLHEAMNPHWHCPVTSRKNEEIVVAGSFYGYRHALVLRLLEEEVKMGLYGRRLPRWCDQKIVSIHRNQFVTRKDKSRIFGEALGCLNSTALTEGNSLNCRAFEIAGAGGLQFLEHRAIIEKCFEPGVEVCTFDSVDELLELIDRAKKEPKWAESIRKASASRALAEHTYAHRLEYIFKKLF